MDFEQEEWKQISNNPLVFQTIKNDVSLEIEDSPINHTNYILRKEESSICLELQENSVLPGTMKISSNSIK